MLIIIRGKVSSGKSYLASLIRNKHPNFLLLDPDLIDISGKDFSNFRPKSVKNPTIKVKKYCYLFQQALKYIQLGKDVIWAQPWSRVTELELTVRNFAYYLGNIKNFDWNIDIETALASLPFRILFIEVDATNATVKERILTRQYNDDYLKQTLKHTKMFQQLGPPFNIYKISGENDDKMSEVILEKLINE